jgi:DNA modification methylase
MTRSRIIAGDAARKLAELPASSIGAVVTDPPYGLEFMGKAWDRVLPSTQVWRELVRVMKPGAHAAVFGFPRLYHRLACDVEDAGLEIRDSLLWLYGSGFPKSLNLRGVWEGWGTALKPAYEPIVLARRALDGTLARNARRHGTGPLNIEGCRVGDEGGTTVVGPKGTGLLGVDGGGKALLEGRGRWPANVLTDEAAAELIEEHARYFYCAKASTSEREAGLEQFDPRPIDQSRKPKAAGRRSPRAGTGRRGDDRHNPHPTVKPIALMRWLVRLIVPPGQVVLDPFVGTGTTAIAAALEGRDYIGIELDPHYARLARVRIDHWRGELEAGREVPGGLDTASAGR